VADTGKYRNEPSGSIKWGGISTLAENRLDSQNDSASCSKYISMEITRYVSK